MSDARVSFQEIRASKGGAAVTGKGPLLRICSAPNQFCRLSQTDMGHAGFASQEPSQSESSRIQAIHTGAGVPLKMLKAPKCSVAVGAGEGSFSPGRLDVDMVKGGWACRLS